MDAYTMVESITIARVFKASTGHEVRIEFKGGENATKEVTFEIEKHHPIRIHPKGPESAQELIEINWSEFEVRLRVELYSRLKGQLVAYLEALMDEHIQFTEWTARCNRVAYNG